MGLTNGKVDLDNNYILWKEMFDNEKKILSNIFPNSVIEHVGSTAVEDLLAKPIIDIAVGLNSLNIDNVIDKLNDYEIKYNSDEILLIKEENNENNYLIHVLDINSDRYKNMIRFRDILINNSKIRKAYEELKINLKNKYSNDRIMYTKSKEDFIKRILYENNNV
jgi:GrpB-like predicted nucleotidyltransferase (UPF0157 family)